MVSYGTDITKCDSAAEFLDRAYNVETCDKQSFASQTIVLAIANKWYELHNNQPNAKARRRRKMLNVLFYPQVLNALVDLLLLNIGTTFTFGS